MVHSLPAKLSVFICASIVQIWNVDKCKPVKQCPTESDYWLIDLAFSPDGSTIVTLSDSIEVRPAGSRHATVTNITLFKCVCVCVYVGMLNTVHTTLLTIDRDVH